jgi:hypothetical protein
MQRPVIDDKEMNKENTGQVRSGTGICFMNSDETYRSPYSGRPQTPYPVGREVDVEALLGGNQS